MGPTDRTVPTGCTQSHAADTKFTASAIAEVLKSHEQPILLMSRFHTRLQQLDAKAYFALGNNEHPMFQQGDVASLCNNQLLKSLALFQDSVYKFVVWCLTQGSHMYALASHVLVL